MILSLVVILLVGIVAYVWASRGFFSAMIHMVCVLVAGAVAFGLWEPIAYAILAQHPPGWVVDMVWGVSLAVPFAAVLAILRLGIDSLLPANAELDGTTNLVGGGVCGAISGTISVGILIIAISFLRLPASFAGHQPMAFESNGSLKRESSLLFPADKITAGLYSFMSRTTLRTGTPMAVWHPRLADEGHLLRTNFNDGGAKHTLTPEGFAVLGRYTVGQDTNVSTKELTGDSFPPERPSQIVMNIDGEPATGSSYVEGVVIQFKAASREKEGRVVIGNAQVRLVCTPVGDPAGASIAIQPFALISQAEGDRLDLGRWRFDKPKIFIASVGGAADSPMAFEFLVPKGYQPLAVYVKGVRWDLRNSQPFQKFADVRGRDSAVRSGAILSSVLASAGELDLSGAIKIDPSVMNSDGTPTELIPTGALGNHILDKGNLQGVQIDDSNLIIQADVKLRLSSLANNRILTRSLQVRQFAGTDDTSVVQLRVGRDSRIGLLSPPALNADMSKAPVLIDDRGQRYVAIGYVYQDSTELHIKLTPGSPIRTASELPNGGPTPSRPDQKFNLVFRVSQGVKIKYFAIGDKVVAEFSPELAIFKPN